MKVCEVCGYEVASSDAINFRAPVRTLTVWRFTVMLSSPMKRLCSPECLIEHQARALTDAMTKAAGAEPEDCCSDDSACGCEPAE